MTQQHRHNTLYQAVTAIDDQYLDEALSCTRTVKVFHVKRIATVAAVLAILLLGHFLLHPFFQAAPTQPNLGSNAIVNPQAFFSITVHANNTIALQIDMDKKHLYYSSVSNNGAINSDTFYNSIPDFIFDPETNKWIPYSNAAERTLFQFDFWPSEWALDYQGLHYVVEYDGHTVSSNDEHISPGFLMKKDENGNFINGYFIKGWFDTTTDVSISLLDQNDLLLQKVTLRVTFSAPSDTLNQIMNVDQLSSNGYIVEVIDQYYLKEDSQ